MMFALLLALAGTAFSGGTTPHDFARYSVLTPAGPDEPSPELFTRIKRLVYADHTVQKGEYSAWHLAKLYGTTAMSLQSTNNDELLVLNPGRRVVVHNKNGLLYEVKKASETLDQIVARYHRDPVQAVKFKQTIVEVNDLPGTALLGPFELEQGDRILLPKVQIPFDTYHFPFQGWGWGKVSSRFGSRYHPVLKRRKMHEGMDLPRPWGTPVYPARSGRVVEAGWHEGYGMLIVIKHSDGATTRYGHLSEIKVTKGDIVQRGKTLIGRVGSTGLSTGPHLHFEVRDKNGRAVNPGSKIGRR